MTDFGGERDHAPKAAEERVDGLLARVSARRAESIRRSMERPLRLELLRTGYIAACILLDVIAVPILMVELAGRPGLYFALLSMIPLAYAQYRMHDAWFVRGLPRRPEGQSD